MENFYLEDLRHIHSASKRLLAANSVSGLMPGTRATKISGSGPVLREPSWVKGTGRGTPGYLEAVKALWERRHLR